MDLRPCLDLRPFPGQPDSVASLTVWPRGLTDEEMRRASDHLINRLGMSI